MLSGEYAVLKGGIAVSSTIDSFLTVEASQDPLETSNGGILIESDLWKKPQLLEINSSQDDAKEASRQLHSDPLVESVRLGAKLFSVGGNVRVAVRSDFPPAHGVGSSSALRLGVLFALREFTKVTETPTISDFDLITEAYNLQKASQVYASGYDFANQYFGGLISFSLQKESWADRVSSCPPLSNSPLKDLIHIIAGGRGAPTSQTIETQMGWLESGTRWNQLIKLAENFSSLLQSFYASTATNPDTILKCLVQWSSAHHALFSGSPAYPHHLDQAFQNLPGYNHDWSVKTTGAGGEDALLFFGYEKDISSVINTLKRFGWSPFRYKFGTKGLQWKSRKGVGATP